MEDKGFYDLQYFKSIYREYLKKYKERIELKGKNCEKIFKTKAITKAVFMLMFWYYCK
jgi:hypothetical protein